MRRLLTLTIAALVAGVGLGAALGYYDARPWTFRQPESDVPSRSTPSKRDQPPGPGPVAEIEEPTFHFDKMEQGALMRHDFVIRNVGSAPLSVPFLSHTCKCTKVELAGKAVDVGDSITAPRGGAGIGPLEWEAKTAAGPFRHGGTFETSDLRRSRIELTVEGEVVESSTLAPSQLNFGPIRVGDVGESELLVVAFVEPEVKIESHEIVEPDLAKFMEVEIEPVPSDQLPTPTASAAARVRVRYRPEGVLGRFAGTLRLETNLKKAGRLVVPIYGSVRGDLSAYGPGWNEAEGLLRLPPVASAEGGRATIWINVRGEHVAETELAVDSVEPRELQAELGEANRLSDALQRFPLTLSIPKGTRPMVRFGEEQGGEGRVVIKTTHPDMPEMRLRVFFVVKP